MIGGGRVAEINQQTMSYGGHAPASKIYLQARVAHALARVTHTPMCGGQMWTSLAVDDSGDAHKQGGVVREHYSLLEIDKSYFEKIRSKDFKKDEDPRL